MEASEPKWVHPNNIWYGVNSLRRGGLHISLNLLIKNLNQLVLWMIKINVYIYACKVKGFISNSLYISVIPLCPVGLHTSVLFLMDRIQIKGKKNIFSTNKFMTFFENIFSVFTIICIWSSARKSDITTIYI